MTNLEILQEQVEKAREERNLIKYLDAEIELNKYLLRKFIADGNKDFIKLTQINLQEYEDRLIKELVK